jgi:hypothetical protein
MLYFRKRITDIQEFFVFLQQNSKKYCYAYQICRKKLPRLCR